MKKKRSLPYGYTIANGQLTIVPQEADTIQEIFRRYNAGASMSEIAELLSSRNIPYCERQTDWDKCKIARILDNKRYTGTKEYLPIIDRKVFRKAAVCKSGRRTKLPTQDPVSAAALVNSRVRCASCGSRMARSMDRRLKLPVTWRCENHNCGTLVRLTSDQVLLQHVLDCMNELIDDPGRLDPEPQAKGKCRLDTKAAKELAALCECTDFSEEDLLSIILDQADEQYQQLRMDISTITSRLRTAYATAKHMDVMDQDLFQNSIEAVLLHADGTVQLRLINGKTT